MLSFTHYVNERAVKLTMNPYDLGHVRIEFPDLKPKRNSHQEAVSAVNQIWGFMPRAIGLTLTIMPIDSNVPVFLLDGPATERLVRFEPDVHFLLSEVSRVALDLKKAAEIYRGLKSTSPYLLAQIFKMLGEQDGIAIS